MSAVVPRTDHEPGRWWICPAFLAVAAFLVVIPLTVFPDPGAKAVAVVYPPWTSATEAFSAAAAAGARIVRQGALPSVLVVVPERSDYALRALASGAWVLLDPRVVGGCGVPTPVSTVGLSSSSGAGERS
ncbi:hypothetical protein [Pararhodospirillum photometricum]|uniref:Uncharacterized protein n=1 Tax=Pararhodospirillum photometricum DSM 122 TaxID=1150469 RepID=H6SQ08_PARPM|nr:hypothetical protein [Pararhodospirillum photometricum]CCG07278.1 Putative uncharacterized protein [Pararhodospirillum photometricum DSM 122]